MVPSAELTSTSLAPGAAEQEVPLNSLRRFSVAEYHALVQSDFFVEDEDFELLEGLLVHKMGKKRRRSLTTQRLRELLEPLLTGFYVEVQEPISTGDSEPEPDVAIVRGLRTDYVDNHPLAKDVALVVEVAGPTLQRDRGLKRRIYARANIPVYWIVNLSDRQIEVHSQPSGPSANPAYASCEIIAAAGEVPVIVEGREVGRLQASDLLY